MGNVLPPIWVANMHQMWRQEIYSRDEEGEGHIEIFNERGEGYINESHGTDPGGDMKKVRISKR